MAKDIDTKAHAELSASGSQRWIMCPASVTLSRLAPEPPPSKYALEGTKAHDLLELWLKVKVGGVDGLNFDGYPTEMIEAVKVCIDFVNENWDESHQELIPEEKLSLEFVGADMFGTADIPIVEHFGKLKVYDYKHGAGKIVELIENPGLYFDLNTQLVYYALAAAHKYDYNFSEVELGIVQPRAKHKDGPIRSIVISMETLKEYIGLFKNARDHCYMPNPRVVTGSWCYWCRARPICPKQEKIRDDRVIDMFDDDDSSDDLGF